MLKSKDVWGNENKFMLVGQHFTDIFWLYLTLLINTLLLCLPRMLNSEQYNQ